MIETGQTQLDTTPAEEHPPEVGSVKSQPPPDDDLLSDMNWKYNPRTGMLPEVKKVEVLQKHSNVNDNEFDYICKDYKGCL